MNTETNDNAFESITHFLFEIGTLRKIMRMHRQTFLTDDMSDNIASHTFRVTMIGWFLSKIENADPYKTVMMCLLHDIPEIRSNDHNWVHKKYVKIFDNEIIRDQFEQLPFADLFDLITEYEKRESKESILAKEADVLDQILLLREYEWAGNKEASLWLHGKDNSKAFAQIKKLQTETGKKLGEKLYRIDPSDWWTNLHTSQNR